MSRQIRSLDPQYVFASRAEVESYFHSKIDRNTAALTGTELELFIRHADGRHLGPQATDAFLRRAADALEGAELRFERGTVVGVNIPGLGDLSLEPGGQVEMSTVPCEDLARLAALNDRLMSALLSTARQQGLSVTGQGHMPDFMTAPDAARSRFGAYYRYCRDQHGAPAEDLIKTMKSVCGLQVNLDPMGADFHEVYRALMLVELAHHFAARSTRQQRLQETYANLFPEQVTPMFNSLAARDNDALVGMIVTRFLTLKVPFLPDPASPEGFKSTIDVFGKPPRIGDLLEKGLLTREVLDNCLSLQMTMPNLRGGGVVETRAPDSTHDLGAVMKTAALYHGFAYDAGKRRRLIDEFAGIDAAKLQSAFDGRFGQGAAQLAASDIGGGKTVGDLIRAVGPLQGAAPVASAPVASAAVSRKAQAAAPRRG